MDWGVTGARVAGEFTAKFLSSGNIPTFFCGAKAVGCREGCLKRPVILHRSSIEVKQKTGFVDRWNMGEKHIHI